MPNEIGTKQGEYCWNKLHRKNIWTEFCSRNIWMFATKSQSSFTWLPYRTILMCSRKSSNSTRATLIREWRISIRMCRTSIKVCRILIKMCRTQIMPITLISNLLKVEKHIDITDAMLSWCDEWRHFYDENNKKEEAQKLHARIRLVFKLTL